MNSLFLGLLFVFLDFNLNLGSSTLGLLPDFVGYILIYKGLEEMAGQGQRFAKGKPWALGMAIYTGVLYVLDLFALSVQMGVLVWVLGLLATVASLVISYWIVAGIQEIEEAHSWDLQSQKLKTIWLFTAVLDGICYILNWIPLVGVIAALAAFIIGICFLVAFYRSKSLYLAHMA